MQNDQNNPHSQTGKYTNSIQEFLAERARRPSGFDMGGSHYHPYYELYYVIAGNCHIFIQYNIYSLSAGDIVFLPPSCLHRVTYEQNQAVDRFTVSFTPDYAYAFNESCRRDELSAVFSRQKLTVPKTQRDRVENLFSDMIHESMQQDCYTQIQKKSLLFQLLALLGRCQDSQQALHLPGWDDSAIQQAAYFIYQHHREPVTLKQAADAGHLSPTYFSKRFRQITGMGFKEYLTHVRLLDAARLLRTTGKSITEIALICGFSDGNYFGDAFKKVLKVSPRQFRKNSAPPDITLPFHY